jgi:hypothetical protein
VKIERTQPTRYVVELHAYELAKLIAAARWAIEAGGDELPGEAVEELQQIVASYDDELTRLGAESRSPN